MFQGDTKDDTYVFSLEDINGLSPEEMVEKHLALFINYIKTIQSKNIQTFLIRR
jgi:hypothetical protein